MEQVKEYVYSKYKNLKDKDLLIVKHDLFYTVRVNKDESPLILSLDVVQMNILSKPESKIIVQGEDMFTILQVVNRTQFVDKNNVINRTSLGYMVKWVGGNHVVQHDDKLLIVEKIQDAQYETI